MTAFAMDSRAVSPAPSATALARRKDLNGAVSWALIVLLALAPLPFGAAHAFSWGLFGTGLGVLALAYVAGLWRAGANPNIQVGEFKWVAYVFALYCAVLILQMAPIGAVLPSLTAFSSQGLDFGPSAISISINQTALMLLRHLSFGVLFFLVLQVSQNPARRELLLKAILAIVMAYCALGIVSLHTGDTILGRPKIAHIGSATGPFLNRNSFATFLAMGAIIALVQAGRALVRQATRHRHDGLVPGSYTSALLYGTCYAVLVGTILATNSRMGILVTLAGSLTAALIVATRLGRSFRGLALIVVIALGAVGPAILLFGEAVIMRLINDEGSASGRLALYSLVLELISQRPWLGFGGGTFEQAAALIVQPPVPIDLRWEKAHSTYLSLWLEMGIIAGSLPVIVVALMGWRLVSALRPDHDDWSFAAIGLCTMIVVALHSVVDFSLEIEANTLIFITIAALAFGTTIGGRPRRPHTGAS